MDTTFAAAATACAVLGKTTHQLSLFYDDQPTTNQYTALAIKSFTPKLIRVDGGHYPNGSVIRVSVYDAADRIVRRAFNPHDEADRLYLSRMAQQDAIPVYSRNLVDGSITRCVINHTRGARQNLKSLLAAAQEHAKKVRRFDFEAAKRDLYGPSGDISFSAPE